MKETLLKLRKQMNARKPKFTRQDSHKKARISEEKWRRPKGLQSKLRYGKKGYKRGVKIGYGSPKEVKHLSKEGLQIIIVNTVSELKTIEEGQGILISSKVGQRKKMDIVKKADELGIPLLNIKDANEYLKSVKEIMQAKKEKKHAITTQKEKKKVEKEKKAEEKKKEDLGEKLTEEEKKSAEKKEREKILTKKEN